MAPLRRAEVNEPWEAEVVVEEPETESMVLGRVVQVINFMWMEQPEQTRSNQTQFKTVYSTVVKHGGVLAMDQYTWRRVVPQRFSGFIVWTPVANDHAAAAYRVVNNSNAGAGSRDWRVQNDYYSDARYLTSRYNGGWLEFSKAGTAPSFSNPHYYHVTIYGAII